MLNNCTSQGRRVSIYFLNTLGGIPSWPGVAPTLHHWNPEMMSVGVTPPPQCFRVGDVPHVKSMSPYSSVCSVDIYGENAVDSTSAFSAFNIIARFRGKNLHSFGSPNVTNLELNRQKVLSIVSLTSSPSWKYSRSGLPYGNLYLNPLIERLQCPLSSGLLCDHNQQTFHAGSDHHFIHNERCVVNLCFWLCAFCPMFFLQSSSTMSRAILIPSRLSCERDPSVRLPQYTQDVQITPIIVIW